MTEQQIIETLATQVMGWHKEEGKYSGKEFWRGEGAGGYLLVSDWNPLQNISDAWQVFEKLIEKHSDATLTYPWCVAAGWQVYREGWRIQGEGNTAQEAICRAALQLIA